MFGSIGPGKLSNRAWMASQSRKIPWETVSVVLLFAASFSLYARTMSPGLLDDDGGEFQTNIYRLGVSHTGYPIYFLLAKLWTLVLPIGSFAYRANLFSGLFGALTVVLVYLTMRTLVASRAASFLAGALLAVSRVEWSQSVIPRPYTLNSFFVVLIILLAILWMSKRISLAWIVGAFGLSLTNHRTMIWFAPALAILILLVEGRSIFRPKRFLTLIFAFFIPLLLYIYVPLRGDSDVGVEYHATNFADMILAGNASIWLRFGPPGFLWWRFTTAYLPLMLEQFTVLGASFGLLGIAAIFFRKLPPGFPSAVNPYHLLLFLGGSHLAESAFAIVFWTFDSEKYFIPSYLTFLFFVGIGLAVVIDQLAKQDFVPRFARRLGPMLVGAIGVAICIYLITVNFVGQDQSANDQAEARWQEILSQPLEPQAMLIGNWESLVPLEYSQYVDKSRLDLQRDKVVIYKDQLALAPQGDVAQFIAGKLENGKAVYLTVHPSQTETLQSVSQRFSLIPVATLWRVENRQSPSPLQTLGARFGDSLLLKSVALNQDFHAGDLASATFDWLADQPIDGRYKFSIRLRDSGGNLWLQNDVEPFGGLKPTIDWPTRQDIQDEEGFFVPPDAPPGDYSFGLAVYNVDTHAALAVDGADELHVTTIHVGAATVAYPREAFQIPHPLNIPAIGAHLVGYGLSNEQPEAGTPLNLQTWWSGLDKIGQDVDVELEDGGGVRTIVYHGPLFRNTNGKFDPRQILRSNISLTISLKSTPGHAHLSLLAGGERISIASFELRSSSRLFNPPQAAHSEAATIDNSIRLIGYDLPKTSISTGGQLLVKLYWHADKPVSQNYKVFVHLLDSAGVLRAQEDSIPQSGALPTNRWLEGEYVPDSYSLSIPSNVPPGYYKLEVGMYSAETGVRAPVEDEHGVRMPDDRVLLDSTIQVSK